ncbi:MAG: zinc-ribbon domain containing protein [Candidatus Staskawiczbacteria bacterium]|nr:zinc-ribbon domain containing protein [Candidatus Staskawiczbacteria bacterium]
MSDLNLKCADCKGDFVFTEGEQKFFTQKGFTPPRRCPGCRAINKRKKQEREQGGNDKGWDRGNNW